jgi:MFS family permease
MSHVAGSAAWRVPIAFQMVFAIGVIFLVFALPESPRWLMTKGRDQEAVDVLCQFYDKEPSDSYVTSEIASIHQAIQLELSSNKNDSFLSIFRKDTIRTRYRILLAWGVQFMNQAGGINLVVYYVPTALVENVGMSPRLALILGGCINMMFMFGSILPSFALDRMGRRKTMIWGCTGLSICMLMVAALLSRVGYSNGAACSSAAVAFFFLYMLIFGMSVNCVPWVYVPEILPLEARTRGSAIGISSNWLWNFTVVMITPVIINRLQWKAYLIFMVTNLLFVPAFYFFYPETSNFKLEDIDMIFSQGGNPVAVARQMSKDMKNGTRSSGSATSVASGKEKGVVVESA